MKRTMKRKWKTWLLIASASLGLHYFMIILAQIVLNGGFSFPALFALLEQRLTLPGDAVRYLDIAQNGYVAEGENAINLVFYPLYPLCIRALGAVLGSLPLAGMAISQLCYGGAAILLYELILLDGTAENAWDGVLLLALYPFSMFVMGVYTEGLFLLLTIGCLYALRREKYPWAGALGFLAALTRTQGMLLIFPAVYEWVTHRLGKNGKGMRHGDAALLLIPAGFGVYLLLNVHLHGNPFQFLLYEAGEPWYQTTQWIGRNIAVQFGQALEYPPLGLFIYWVQIALYFFTLGVLLFGARRQERVAYLLYGGAYLGFTYLSGWMISGGRYMLCCVPVYLVLCKVRPGVGKKLHIAGEALLFFSYSLFYLQGFAIM